MDRHKFLNRKQKDNEGPEQRWLALNILEAKSRVWNKNYRVSSRNFCICIEHEEYIGPRKLVH